MKIIAKSKALGVIVNAIDKCTAQWNDLDKEVKSLGCINNPVFDCETGIMYSSEKIVEMDKAIMSSLEGQIKTLQEIYLKIKRL